MLVGRGDPGVPNKRWMMGTGEFLGAGIPGTARLATKRHCPRRCQKSGPDIVLVFASVHKVPPPFKDYLFVYLFKLYWRRHKSWCLSSLSPFRMSMLIDANADNPARKHRQVKGCSTTGLSSETPKRIRLTLSASTFFKDHRPAVSIHPPPPCFPSMEFLSSQPSLTEMRHAV